MSASQGLLANDRNPAGGALTAHITSSTSNATITVNSDGSFVYHPNLGGSFLDEFGYEACNAANQCTAGTARMLVGSPESTLYQQYLWMVTPGSNTSQQSFVRLLNHSVIDQTVTLWGIDSAGHRSPNAASTVVPANGSRQFNSRDLEFGNGSKGLGGNLGSGSGGLGPSWWRREYCSGLDALAYIRTPDGFLTSMHDRVPGNGVEWDVDIFNPADNSQQASRLRLINKSATAADVLIEGRDDAGTQSGEVALRIAPRAAVELTSGDLEHGNAGLGLTGALGDGTGKWRLHVSSSADLAVMSLLADPKGYLTDLSSRPLHVNDPNAAGGEKTLWFVPRASNTSQQGFIRLVNGADQGGDVAIWGIDDAGKRSTGTITFSLPANASIQLNSQDLEGGNASKGISGSLGAGTGDWDSRSFPISICRRWRSSARRTDS